MNFGYSPGGYGGVTAFPIPGLTDLSTIGSYGNVPMGAATSGIGAGGTLGSLAGPGALGGAGAAGGLGLNIPTAQLGLQGLGTIAGLFGAMQSQRLARDQFNFTKDVTNTNLTNQIQSYNTALADRARSRAAAEGRDQSTADDYVARNRLTR